MMDPEMLRLAQEQMSRIPPDQLLKMQQQMMSNPDLIRMATEGMKNLNSDSLRFASEQMKRLRPEDMAEMSSRMASASPEELSAMRAQAEVQQNYEFQASLSLKDQGNHLHRVGKFKEAAEKYQRAKQNLSGMLTSDATNLRRTCSLNLMSCYLKLQQYDDTVAEGTEVLESDSNNLKALYRRGQAYKELGKLKLAFKDLNRAAQIDPNDETVKEVLGHLKDELECRGEELIELTSTRRTNGPLIEEIVEENTVDSLDECQQEHVPSQEPVSDRHAQALPDVSQTIESLRQNPEMVRSMYSMMGNLSPEQIASMSGGQVNPEMAKIASDMVRGMSPEDMQRMMDMMATVQRPPGSSSQATSNELSSSDVSTRSPGSQTLDPRMRSSSNGLGSNDSQSFGMPNLGPEMQEEMRQRMKDPAMKQMMASMLRTMTPETMVGMSEQMGLKLSPEEAQKAHTAMANLSPSDIEKLMKWADRVQRVWDYAKRGKNFLLGRPGLVLALVMLALAVILHWCGMIGY